MPSKIVGHLRVFITLEEHISELKMILSNLPITPTRIFSLVLKLWDLKRHSLVEYDDELFSAVMSELHESPILAKQLREANLINREPHLTVAEASERIFNVAVSRINAAVWLLDKPLETLLGPILTSYNATVDDVKIVGTVGVCFEVVMSIHNQFVPIQPPMPEYKQPNYAFYREYRYGNS